MPVIAFANLDPVVDNILVGIFLLGVWQFFYLRNPRGTFGPTITIFIAGAFAFWGSIVAIAFLILGFFYLSYMWREDLRLFWHWTPWKKKET